MSFDFPQQSQPRVRRSGGCGCGSLLFMLIIMFAAYYMFSGALAPRGPQPNQQQPPNRPLDQVEDIFGQDRDRSGTDRQDLKDDIFGDGEVDARGRPKDDSPRQMPSRKRSDQSNDWQMDDVKSGSGASRSNPKNERERSPATSGSRNDWSIQEVDPVTAERETVPSLNPAPGNQGGWQIEDVETDK